MEEINKFRGRKTFFICHSASGSKKRIGHACRGILDDPCARALSSKVMLLFVVDWRKYLYFL